MPVLSLTFHKSSKLSWSENFLKTVGLNVPALPSSAGLAVSHASYLLVVTLSCISILYSITFISCVSSLCLGSTGYGPRLLALYRRFFTPSNLFSQFILSYLSPTLQLTYHTFVRHHFQPTHFHTCDSLTRSQEPDTLLVSGIKESDSQLSGHPLHSLYNSQPSSSSLHAYIQLTQVVYFPSSFSWPFQTQSTQIFSTLSILFDFSVPLLSYNSSILQLYIFKELNSFI